MGQRRSRKRVRVPLRPRHSRRGGSLSVLELIALMLAAGVGLTVALALSLSLRRLRRRRTRTYELYELHLSTHDQAKAQDLEDMVEAIANIVRAWPTDRARNGQPYLAFELICSANGTPGPVGQMEWSLNVRCEPRRVTAIDGAISAAYPDVRLGRLHGEQPQPRTGALREPRCLVRFCKERSFVYSLIAAGEELGLIADRADRARPDCPGSAVGGALPAHPDPGVV